MRPGEKAVVGVVSAACLLVLVVVLKNVLLIPPEVISRDMVIYIIIYFGFITAANLTSEPREGEGTGKTWDTPWMWSALAVAITLGIIGVYALG